MKLTEVQRNEIRRQRTEGIGYIRIANDLGISVCQHCGKTITAYASRKYCSHDCYIADRFGGDERE